MLRWFLNGENQEEVITDEQINSWYAEGQEIEAAGGLEAEEYLEEKIKGYIASLDNRPVHFVLLSADPLYWSHFHFSCNLED